MSEINKDKVNVAEQQIVDEWLQMYNNAMNTNSDRISKSRVRKAIGEMCKIFKENGLTMQEIEIVTRSGCVAAGIKLKRKQIQTEEIENAERDNTPKIIRWLPTICGLLAIIISLISIFASVLK